MTQTPDKNTDLLISFLQYISNIWFLNGYVATALHDDKAFPYQIAMEECPQLEEIPMARAACFRLHTVMFSTKAVPMLMEQSHGVQRLRHMAPTKSGVSVFGESKCFPRKK